MMYFEPPKEFNPKFEVVSCLVECRGEILLLHRHNDKPHGGKWGLPAGKINPGETKLPALAREIREETNLVLPPETLVYLKTVYVKYMDFDFVYHMYKTVLANKRNIVLSPSEHQDSVWVTPIQALKMNLIQDETECIKLIYNL